MEPFLKKYSTFWSHFLKVAPLFDSLLNLSSQLQAIHCNPYIRQEEGNLQYEYFLPMEDEETVLLIDSWADQAALDRHHHTPMMQTIMALREKYDLHMRVVRYVSDDTTTGDEAFIRK